jgi:hypothetical protein
MAIKLPYGVTSRNPLSRCCMLKYCDVHVCFMLSVERLRSNKKRKLSDNEIAGHH